MALKTINRYIQIFTVGIFICAFASAGFALAKSTESSDVSQNSTGHVDTIPSNKSSSGTITKTYTTIDYVNNNAFGGAIAFGVMGLGCIIALSLLVMEKSRIEHKAEV